MYFKASLAPADFLAEQDIPPKKEVGRPGRKSKKSPTEPEEDPPEEPQESQVVPAYDLVEQLVSPARFSFVFEHWTPLQIAIFEAGVCQFGRQWQLVSRLVPDKTRHQVIEFYYLWKQSSHYRVWKVHQNSTNKGNLNHWL